ncbi:transposase [Paracoccus versutus]
MARLALRDREWALIAPLLPDKPWPCADARPARPERVFSVLREGSPWRDLPERYGPHATASNRWARVGVWLRVF